MIQRGDLVTVALPGDLSELRPALVIQSDFLTELGSIVLCPMTNDVRTAAFRVTVEPTAYNCLTTLSQVMVDKISTVPRSKVSVPFGKLEDDRMRAVDRALLLVVGLT